MRDPQKGDFVVCAMRFEPDVLGALTRVTPQMVFYHRGYERRQSRDDVKFVGTEAQCRALHDELREAQAIHDKENAAASLRQREVIAGIYAEANRNV